MRRSLYIALLVAFVDNMGVGLIYPLLSSLIFDPTVPLLSCGMDQKTRGALLGFLIALMPLAQFFSAPIWGALSDGWGRKRPLQASLAIALVGYLIALCGVWFQQFALLLLSRVVVGFASGNMSIVQATVADLSTPQNKTKNFGLYSMALGAGFTLGPFFGGALAIWGYGLPFLFASIVMAINLLLANLFFKETHHHQSPRVINWNMGFSQLRKAFEFKGIRAILFCSFLHNFGWSFFFEFSPIYLITQYRFTALDLGIFFGVAGGCYAISTGALIRPFISRFKPEMLFFFGNFLSALTILVIPFLPGAVWIWPLVVLLCYFVAFVTPTSTTLVSNSAGAGIQGEALGVLTSVNATALVLSPLFSGSIVGAYPSLSMWIGGAMLFAAAAIVLGAFGKKLFEV